VTALPAEIAAIDWYHTIDLPDGTATPGFYDHRRLVGRLPFPASLAGKRCLDVAGSDGFWAFEMWRRGATEVISIDLADPARQEWQGAPSARRAVVTSNRWESQHAPRASEAFEVARAALGAAVERRHMSVYDLSPETVGTFDFVFIGNLLLHIRDPAGALVAARTVCGGDLLLLEPVLVSLSVLFPRTPLASLWQLDEPRWWQPNLAGLRRLVEAAGFAVRDTGGPRAQRFGKAFPRRPPLRRPSLSELVFWTLVRPFGVPTAWVLAEPLREPSPTARERVPLLGWI
jgi:tRNA (mo5U34)-methyltransferase